MTDINRIRGEVGVKIQGEIVPICLTLGALSKIETALGCESLADLQVRMKQLSASELMLVFGELLNAGASRFAQADVKTLSVSPGHAAKAVAEAFHVALA